MIGEKIFPDKEFYVTRIKREYNSPTRSFIVFLKGHEYEVSYNCLERFLTKHNMSIRNLNLRNLRTEEVDSRPLYKKAMDFQMGKKVDFKKSHTYMSVDERFLEKNLF